MNRSRVRAVTPAQLPSLAPLCPGAGEVHACLHEPSAAWARAAQDRWGLCGVSLVEEGFPIAVALVCPGPNVPEGHPLGAWSRPPCAAYLVALGCGDEDQGERRTRWLVQGLARHLQGRVSTLEAAGGDPRADCLTPPVAWLEAAGFRPVDEARRGGLVRLQLDLGNSVDWRPRLDRAWGLLQGLVPHPVTGAEPSSRDMETPPTPRFP